MQTFWGKISISRYSNLSDKRTRFEIIDLITVTRFGKICVKMWPDFGTEKVWSFWRQKFLTFQFGFEDFSLRLKAFSNEKWTKNHGFFLNWSAFVNKCIEDIWNPWINKQSRKISLKLLLLFIVVRGLDFFASSKIYWSLMEGEFTKSGQIFSLI